MFLTRSWPHRYLEAWERRHDYDLYCVLAGQFWPLEAGAFRTCNRPGKKLFLEIEAPATVIIRMWKTCWPFRKVNKPLQSFFAFSGTKQAGRGGL